MPPALFWLNNMKRCHALRHMILFLNLCSKSLRSATLLVFSIDTQTHASMWRQSAPPPQATITCLFLCCLDQIKVQSSEYGAFFTGESTAATFRGCINETGSTLHRLPWQRQSDDNTPENSPRWMISINAQQEGKPLHSGCLFAFIGFAEGRGGGKGS